MNKEIETGGPAFPDWPESAFPSTFKSISPGEPQIHRWGMTLRDYFAAKAMQGYLTGDALLKASDTAQEWIDKTAAASYQMADAMLKAREQ